MQHSQFNRQFTLSAHILPWALLIFFLLSSLLAPDTMLTYLAKDEEGGLVENLTVLFLLPGIAAGLYGFFACRRNIRPWYAAWWLLMWTLACIYFAGEEVSWGQWYFQWETPESIARINDQGETNLHNTSTWFDQKPRTLVELWIFATGLVWPILRWLRKAAPYASNSWQYWLHPVNALVSAALFFTLVRFAGWAGVFELRELFGSSELREMCVALFLSLYLISFPLRACKD
ncbi:MAG: hypothetical protein PVG66_16610 [Chromatiales bacterium]|jgi:hypothetical protein